MRPLRTAGPGGPAAAGSVGEASVRGLHGQRVASARAVSGRGEGLVEAAPWRGPHVGPLKKLGFCWLKTGYVVPADIAATGGGGRRRRRLGEWHWPAEARPCAAEDPAEIAACADGPEILVADAVESVDALGLAGRVARKFIARRRRLDRSHPASISLRCALVRARWVAERSAVLSPRLGRSRKTQTTSRPAILRGMVGGTGLEPVTPAM